MSYNTSYGIQFIGTNYVTPAADAVVENLNRISQGTTTVNWNLQQMGSISSMGFHNLIFGAQMSLFYVSMLASGMMRAESATIGVEMAQDHLNDTIKRYGPNSQEALRATQSLERSQLMLNRQNVITNITMGSMGLQMVSMAASMNKYAIPALIDLAKSLYGAAAGAVAFLATNPAGWAVLIGGVAAASVAGLYLLNRPAELPSTLTINSGNTEQVLEDYKRRLKRAITQSGVP